MYKVSVALIVGNADYTAALQTTPDFTTFCEQMIYLLVLVALGIAGYVSRHTGEAKQKAKTNAAFIASIALAAVLVIFAGREYVLGVLKL